MDFHLKIAASDRAFYDGPCQSLILPTPQGQYGILANHESMVVGIDAGQLRYQAAGAWTTVVIGVGFARIHDNMVIILADTVELPDEIDFNRALEAKRMAEESMLDKRSRQEYYQGKLAMARAMARLSVKPKSLDD